MTDTAAAGREDEAFELALRALRHRDRSAAEVEERLERGGVDVDVRAAVLARLTAVGYVDDVRFAERRAESLAARGSGDELIAGDLRARGVAPETAADALATIAPEAERAAEIVARRGASERTLRFLASRGFSEEALEAVVAECGGTTIR